MAPMTLAPDDPRHGTDNGYTNLSCRCRPCQNAKNIRQRDYLNRHPEQQRKKRDAERRRRGLLLHDMERLERRYQSRNAT